MFAAAIIAERSRPAKVKRLARIVGRERWSDPGAARWLFEEKEEPWPAAAEDAATRRAVRETTSRLLGASDVR